MSRTSWKRFLQRDLLRWGSHENPLELGRFLNVVMEKKQPGTLFFGMTKIRANKIFAVGLDVGIPNV